jgi:hypothetical protein
VRVELWSWDGTLEVPLAASRQHVEIPFKNLAHIDRALAADMLGWWDYGLIEGGRGSEKIPLIQLL